MGQDIDIPANILNIYYVFSFIDPKICRLFLVVQKTQGLNPETRLYRSSVLYRVRDSYVDLTVEYGQNMPVLA